MTQARDGRQILSVASRLLKRRAMRSISGIAAFMFMFINVAHGDEVIDIHDIAVPKVMPKPTPASYDPLRIPAYSDEAALDDVWVRSWLLLDIDARGNVVRFKFLNHPGYGLEPIAIKEAFKVKFAPARDNRDKPTETFALWRIEWPAFDYMREVYGETRWVPQGMFASDPSPLANVRCLGTGPLNLTTLHPVYRDCRQPDISKVDAEPWVFADGHLEYAHTQVNFVKE
jgi:hypothetical protein